MLKINKILSKKIKSPLSLRGAKQACPCVSRGSNLSGFSLIELMIAAVILALAIFGIFQAFGTGFLGMFDARDRTVATNYVQEKMEELKNADFDTVVDEASSQIVGDIKFSRNVNVEYINGSTNLIVVGPTNLKRVTTTVNWTDRNGVAKKVESSVLLQHTQFTPGDADRISLYANPYNVVLPVTNSTTIIAVIKDKHGNTVIDWDGSDVTFSITSGDSLGTLSDYAVTPVRGIAKVIFTSGTDPDSPGGTVTVEASITTSDVSNIFTDTIDIKVTWGAVKIKLIPDPSSIYADGSSRSTIIAIIENAAGVRVDEALNDITFTVAGEGILIGPTTKPANETYDSVTGGVATILLQSTDIPGIATVTASSTELFSDSCDVQTSGEPAGITLSASPNPVYSDDISEVTVTIVDENGVPVVPIPTSTITINLSVSGGTLDGSLSITMTFTNLSYSQTTTFTPDSTDIQVEATVEASGTFPSGLKTTMLTIVVEPKLIEDHIVLEADPPTIPVGGGTEGTSIITATVKDEEGNTVHNYEQIIYFVTTYGNLSAPEASCVNGVATVQLQSDAIIPGTATVTATDIDLSLSASIDVGFYTTADYILLTAVPDHIHVGGGNEGTTKLTAYIKDELGITVYDYDGRIKFSFISGFDEEIAKFKFVTEPDYSVPVFHGEASAYLESIFIAGNASLEAFSPPEFSELFSNVLTIIVEKTLKLAEIPEITYFQGGKNVSFNIDLMGGELLLTEMQVYWSSNGLETLNKIDIGDNPIYNNDPDNPLGSAAYTGDSDIRIVDIDVDIDVEDIFIPIGISTITMYFNADISEKTTLNVIFNPNSDNYIVNLK